VILLCVRWYVVEQDHRAIKRRTRPMLGFKDFNWAYGETIIVGMLESEGHPAQLLNRWYRVVLPGAPQSLRVCARPHA
jgi:hypothetical protein